jgi:preprotein translocase subunit SecE
MVAEDDKGARAQSGESSLPSWAAGAVSFVPGKFREGKAFFSEVRTEMKKVTWPARPEVYTTTVVVIFTSIFFGFYLWGLDLAISQAMSVVLK